MTWPTGVLGEPVAVCPPGCMHVDCATDGHRTAPRRLGKGVGQAVRGYQSGETRVVLTDVEDVPADDWQAFVASVALFVAETPGAAVPRVVAAAVSR